MSNGTKQTPITTRQMQVMELVWSHGDITVREAKDALDDDLAYTSVLTVFQTLESKGWVGHHQDGKAYRYYAEVERSEAAERVTMWLINAAPSLAQATTEKLAANFPMSA